MPIPFISEAAFQIDALNLSLRLVSLRLEEHRFDWLSNSSNFYLDIAIENGSVVVCILLLHYQLVAQHFFNTSKLLITLTTQLIALLANPPLSSLQRALHLLAGLLLVLFLLYSISTLVNSSQRWLDPEAWVYAVRWQELGAWSHHKLSN